MNTSRLMVLSRTTPIHLRRSVRVGDYDDPRRNSDHILEFAPFSQHGSASARAFLCPQVEGMPREQAMSPGAFGQASRKRAGVRRASVVFHKPTCEVARKPWGLQPCYRSIKFLRRGMAG